MKRMRAHKGLRISALTAGDKSDGSGCSWVIGSAEIRPSQSKGQPWRPPSFRTNHPRESTGRSGKGTWLLVFSTSSRGNHPLTSLVKCFSHSMVEAQRSGSAWGGDRVLPYTFLEWGQCPICQPEANTTCFEKFHSFCGR